MKNFLAEAHAELDRLDGTVVADFIDVQDGFYTQRIMLDELPVAGPVAEGPSVPGPPLAFHYEPCHMPRFLKQLIWRSSEGSGA